jgi:holo-[acyl-carrier protein] synthase
MTGVIGIGIDLIAVTRIEAALCRHGGRFVDRLLSDDESRDVIARAIRGPRLLEYLAGRFAAKEAVAKASGCGIAVLGWRNIEILADRGAPRCRLVGRAAEAAARRGIVAVQVSITHERGLAAACAVAIGDLLPPATDAEVS